MTVKPKTTRGATLMIDPQGHATCARDGADFRYLVREGWQPVGPRGKALAAEIRRRDARTGK